MRVFLDFEASSLGKRSYPIEVAWVFEDGQGESHLIRPAPGWDEWEPRAEAIHHIPRAMLEAEGEAHDVVAQRMVEVLSGHDLFASAPSWDGKWLSILLRAAKLPRHALRLRDTEVAQREAAAGLSDEAAADIIALARVEDREPVRHRALADAQQELRRYLHVREMAEAARAR